MSPFGYNETIGHDFYPMSREDVLERGWRWRDESPDTHVSDTYTPLDIRMYDERYTP